MPSGVVIQAPAKHFQHAWRKAALYHHLDNILTSVGAGDLQDLMTAPQEQSEPAYMDAMPLAPGPDAVPETAPDAGFSEDAAAKYDAVMAFCLSRRNSQVLFTTLMTEFVNIHLGDLERYDRLS